MSTDRIETRVALLSAALRVLQSEYIPPDDPTGGWEAEYVEEQLALAARDHVKAVDAQPKNDQPVGWSDT